MKRFSLLVLPFTILGLGACSISTAEQIGDTVTYEHNSGATVTVRYETDADNIGFKMNAKKLLADVTKYKLEDIGFYKADRHSESNSGPVDLLCELTFTYTETLAITGNGTCEKDGEKISFSGKVFEAVRLLNDK